MDKKQALAAAIADQQNLLHSRTGRSLSDSGRQAIRDNLVKLSRKR